MGGKRVIIVTGANRGIGRATTSALVAKGHSVVMACRDVESAVSVRKSIQEGGGSGNIEVIHLDLASLQSVRKFAKIFSDTFPGLDVLINNAGVFIYKKDATRDGFEKTMGTNYLGPFLLTNLLLPKLRKSTDGRIINVASNAYRYGWIDINDLASTNRFQIFRTYAASKLALVLFTLELADRLRDTEISVNAVHPGEVGTNIWRSTNMFFGTVMKLMRPFLATEEKGAETSIYLALSDEIKDISGRYFEKKTEKEIPEKIRNSQIREKLWEMSERLVGLS